ncbi:AAA family ATPase [Bradyrhizobium sp. 62B]|uniref:AAA family ATPase n=2 Tax=Pseudomonadota TaxID=1224 RepID=UPI002557FA85|nr:AAA family ATPase [Bradyrhizobium sp. 62B]
MRFNAAEASDPGQESSAEGVVTLRRIQRNASADDTRPVTVLAAFEPPASNSSNGLAHEYGLTDCLDREWALVPLELVQEPGRTFLTFEDPGGELLSQLLGMPMEIEAFLQLAIGIVAAVGKMHQRGLVHKDIKPGNILVSNDGAVRLTGFGVASRIPRERQPPDPPQFIAGTLPYMAPEQTGRMNRSIDSRSDLYALGVTFYQMLTGSLPFNAVDAMEWIHCHVARRADPPDERVSGIPQVLSSIVMKLLAKTAEERYQTAQGVEADLRHCLGEWQLERSIEPFPLAAHDTSDRLLIPEQLYGREREIEALLAAFDRVVAQGKPELVLISGYSGVGKSSVVNELHKVLVPPRGLFAGGKFDQYKRDIPYATLAPAFQRLVRLILARSEGELSRWRATLLQAIEPHGGLVVDLVPELRFIIGEQEPAPELPAADAPRRFQLLLRRLIGVFARPEHPLALFLDDLQWLDAATLDLLEDLLTQGGVSHLLLIGAYRDNEVDASHPLMRKLASINAAGRSPVREIKLGPLNAQDVSRLIADALHAETDQVRDLAQLILQKTDGNPFFINQFLSALRNEGLIAFDSASSRWSWDLKRIHAKGYTDNVADLMIGKLARLPAATQQALQHLAGLGNIATAEMLAIVHDTPEQELHATLIEARRQELVDLLEGSYRFVHDRVQEAAYALIPIKQRATVHLRIGRLLVAHTSPGKLEEAIFGIVSQLNRASSLIAAPEEREQLATFNLIAGKRARASSAYVSALHYLTTGAALFTEDEWGRHHELRFALELVRAHCEFASGATADAEMRLHRLSLRAATAAESAAVACLQVDLYQGVGRSDEAVAIGLRSLRQLGFEFPEHPTEEDARRAYDDILIRLGDRAIEDLVNLPRMSDPESLAVLELLNSIVVPSKFFGSPHLFAVILCAAIRLGLERGHGGASCFAYVQLGAWATYLGQFDAGYRFARLACELVEQPGWQSFQARTFQTFGIVVPWTQPVRSARDFLVRGFDLASRFGEISYAAYACNQLNTNYLVAGDPLIETQEQVERAIAFVRKVGSRTVEASLLGQLGLVRSLRGLTARLGTFDDALFQERDLERELAGNPALALSECWYYIRKLQARFLAGEYRDALQAATRAQPMVETAALPLPEFIEYHFYAALCHAALHAASSSEEREHHFASVTDHLARLKTWARHCPENFANRAALVGAELARIEGRDGDAERLYQQAIRSAHASLFVHNEALACEVAARFYAARELDDISEMHLQRAREGYRRWGADGKVRQLDRLLPYLATSNGQHSVSPGGSSVHHLDVTSVVKASQALSSEIELPKLIERLMTIAIENAGADRGLLMLPSANGYLIRAEARASGDQIEVALRHDPITPVACPESLVRYVIRTRESVILDDASKPSLFSADDYLRDRPPRSVLCLPLMKQRELAGVLLLENTLTSHVFVTNQITVLELLAAQAAISLENTRLYGDLAQAVERRKQADVYLTGEKHVLEMMATSCPLRDVLAALCRFFEESAPDCCCGIYPIDGRSKTFEFGVAPSLPASYTSPIEGASVAADDSPRGRSIAEKAQVITPDIGSDPRWIDAPCRAHVLEHGLRAVWSTPICSREGTVIGTVCVYQEEAASPSAHHQEVIAHVVHLASIAIERSQAEAVLRRDEFYLTEGQRIGLTGTFAWDVTTDEVMFSDQLKRIFEFELDTVVTIPLLRERIHPDDLRSSGVYLQEVQAGLDSADYELRLRMPDDRIKYLSVCARMVRHEDGQVECLGAIQDITRRRLAENARDSIRSELAHVSRVVSLGALTASIAHEVNQPLASIVTSSETALRWLSRPEPDFGKVEPVLKRVVSDARRAADIIDRIRTMAGKGVTKRSEITLAEIISECMALLHHELQSRQLSISLDLDPNLPKVMVDRTQLQQVVVNLVVNAAHAVSNAGIAQRNVVVRTRKVDPDKVCCIVEDSGPGIEPEHLPKLFDSFFTTKETGMGLGLPIAQSIIEAHYGRILADNESSLGGARFVFELPASSFSAAQTPSTHKH